MTIYNRADIVLVPVPYTDRDTVKNRPAVILSTGAFNKRNEYIVAAISSSMPLQLSKDEVLITGAELTMCGLPKESFVIPSKIFTLDHDRVQRFMGKMPPSLFRRVIQIIAQILEIRTIP